jgi:ParB-like chromosome segregation protein Spo0J
LPIDEGVVKDIMGMIGNGDVSALPPVHLWRKQPGANPILVAGRNRLEAHKRSGREVITARVITGETPEVILAVQLIAIDENLNRRELSPALRLSLTKQRKGLYEEKYPETKRGSAGGKAKADKSANSQNATEQPPAFIDAQAKRTGRHRATIAREISEAEKLGDAVMKKIVGTSLDKQSEITALAATDEQERQKIVDRAVAGEKVSAAKLARDSTARGAPKQSGCDDAKVPNLDLKGGDTLEVKNYQCGHVLRPGGKKEIDLPVDEIEAFRSLSAPNRGVYTFGPQAGLPLPPLPLRFIDIPQAPSKRVDDGGGGDIPRPKAK